ncbi:cobalt ECF transporter T component CbiQ [Desulfobulbus alkaliphilus]|uniref:cobalt ECF transporter T component CbiQ n=1 Tax=Desulfobulbus alkaliphilus TaxID=869814 RepID=UPI001964C8FC|nr:cobalt ECF transporter T component CbiQ [Desulfobulbus alkaliphilus]MBM9536077.1 cobalt ECF transporter T component CbiQ [Desulfobulbus alkaliphilus]
MSHQDNRPDAALLYRWDPRLRIVALLLLAFAFSSIKELHAIPAITALTLFFWVISGLPARRLWHRLRYPSLLIVLLAVTLPFAGGSTPLLNLGPLTMTQEGLESALLITARFYAILILALCFLGSTPVHQTIRAFQALGLPGIMADIALLMVRYLEVLAQDLQRMRRSMQVRGYQGRACSWKTIRTTALLTGNLLLRSYERADGVYKAMRVRGYGHKRPTRGGFSATMADKAAIAAVTVMAIGLTWFG